jgi:hypothetical protein
VVVLVAVPAGSKAVVVGAAKQLHHAAAAAHLAMCGLVDEFSEANLHWQSKGAATSRLRRLLLRLLSAHERAFGFTWPGECTSGAPAGHGYSPQRVA